MIRRAACLLAALAIAGMGMLATAPVALAHATVVSTDPADGAILPKAPASVSMTFDEPVGVSTDSLRVFTPAGGRADSGQTTHGSVPQQITIKLLPGLGPGTYTVGWHVISADSHPVQGAFTFSVGAPSSTAVNTASLLPPTSMVVSILFGIVRWLSYCCFALFIGAVADHSGIGIQVPLSLPSDTIHLSAMAIWIGGLVTLVTIVLRRADSAVDTRRVGRRRYQAATAEAAQAVARFSLKRSRSKRARLAVETTRLATTPVMAARTTRHSSAPTARRLPCGGCAGRSPWRC